MIELSEDDAKQDRDAAADSVGRSACIALFGGLQPRFPPVWLLQNRWWRFTDMRRSPEDAELLRGFGFFAASTAFFLLMASVPCAENEERCDKQNRTNESVGVTKKPEHVDGALCAHRFHEVHRLGDNRFA